MKNNFHVKVGSEKGIRQVVANSQDSNFNHSTDYLDFLISIGHKIICLVIYEEEKPVALITGFEQRGRFNTPLRLKLGDKFGPIPLIVDEKKDNLALLRFCKDVIIQKFKKNFFISKYAYLSVDTIEHKFFYQPYISLNRKPSMIISEFKKSCRNSISKAVKEGVNIRISEDISKLEEFLASTDIEGFDSPSESQEVIKLFKKVDKSINVELWFSYYKKKPLSVAIIIKFKDKISLYYMRSSENARKLSVNNLLISSMIKNYVNTGFKYFYLGGLGFDIYGELKGYGNFKKSFNPIIDKKSLLHKNHWTAHLLKAYNIILGK